MSKVYDVCLIGLGPAGIGFLSSIDATVMSNTICFEKGSVDSICNCHTGEPCFHCEPCSIVSGLGGASSFSCGKISDYPAGSGMLSFFDSKDSMSTFMKSEIEALKSILRLEKFDISTTKQMQMKTYFLESGIKYKYYDVYEFRKEAYYSHLKRIICNAANKGARIVFNTEVNNISRINSKNGQLYSISIKDKRKESIYMAKKVILATGNVFSNNSTIELLLRNEVGFNYEIGVRVVVLTEKISNYLNTHGDLKLKYKNGRTYCVSRDGYIIAYSINGIMLLEGYTDKTNPTNVTNFAIIFKENNKQDLDSFKSKYYTSFSGIPIKQNYSDYLSNTPSTYTCLNEPFFSAQNGNINNLFSQRINRSISDFIDSVLINTMGLSKEDITLYAPELKETYCYNINKSFQVSTGIYIIGAATGKFRGILQSYCSGILCGKNIRR